MQNLQNLHSISSLSGGNKTVAPTTQSLSDYIKSISGLDAYYKLDETSGNAINTAPATIGTLDGTITGATQGVAGLVGNAYSFDGVNDKVTFPEIEVTNTSKISIVALVNPSSVATFHTIMCKRTGATTSFAFRIGESSGDRKLVWLWSVGGVNQSYIGSQPTVSASTNTLVGLNFDWATPGTVDFFKNGVKTTVARSFGVGVNPDDANVGVTIGATADDALDYSGTMQHVARCTSNISDAEHLRIAQLAGLA